MMKKTALKLIIAVAIAMATLFATTSSAFAEVIVIANNQAPVSKIDKGSLADIYLGKKSFWSGNTAIAIAMLKQGPTHEEFLKKYIGKTSSQFQSYWNKILFTGAGTPPTSFNSERELVEWVAKTKGAIGYIDSATPHDAVKVLPVQ